MLEGGSWQPDRDEHTYQRLCQTVDEWILDDKSQFSKPNPQIRKSVELINRIWWRQFHCSPLLMRLQFLWSLVLATTKHFQRKTFNPVFFFPIIQLFLQHYWAMQSDSKRGKLVHFYFWTFCLFLDSYRS